jgi:hypothetical protein
MTRRPRIACFCLLALLLAAVTAGAQTSGRIFYYNRAKKKDDVEQRIRIKEESPKELTLERGTRTEKLPAMDVLDIDYQIPADLNLDIRAKAKSAEDAALKETDLAKRLKSNDAAIAGYRDLIEKLPKEEQYDAARRHTEYKIAVILARQAEDDTTRRDEALKALIKFKTDHAKSWQIGTLGKLLARVQTLLGDQKAALATFDEFARRDDLAEPVRQEYELLGIRTLLSSDNFTEAERKLTSLAKTLAKDDPQSVRVEIYLAACKGKSDLSGAEKRLQAVIRSDVEPAVKALAYNTLGDCYRANDLLEKAFWQYLWVDQEYTQDREEHAKALYYLSILFDKVKKMPARAQACRDRLLSEKPFAGLEYQKLAAKESQRSGGDK